MKPDDLEKVITALKGTVETTVNGKINHLSEKLDKYIQEDSKWKQEKVEPLIDAHRTIKNMAIFLKWTAGIVVSVGVLLKIVSLEKI